MVLENNTLSSYHSKPMLNGAYVVPPMYQVEVNGILPSAPPPSEIYEIPKAPEHAVPAAQTVNSSSTSLCAPWLIIGAVVAVAVIGGGIAIAVVVTNNKNYNDAKGNFTRGTTEVAHTERPCDFRCYTSQCISQYEVCDGDWDCASGEDETGCSSTAVTCSDYVCSSGTPDGTSCIQSSWVCDGFTDCLAGEDECGCTSNPQPVYCRNGTLYCDGICISSIHVCDGVEDCSFGSDEFGCPNAACSEYNCQHGVYPQYGSSSCIHSSLLCDGIEHCIGGYDEQNCVFTTPIGSIANCTANSIHCDGRCISQSKICDGHADCSHSADEQNCTASVTCSSSQFTCTDGGAFGTCIPGNWECDNIIDCTGATDEMNCSCDNNEYTCHNTTGFGRCIASHKVCDGIEDCNGGADEGNCTICASNSIYCDGVCIPHFDVCDGHPHCNDSADEQNCTTASTDITCSPFQYTCVDGGVFGNCIPGYWECDNIIDCLGATDEANCSCNSDQFKCQNGSAHGSCIYSHKVCDGTEDCNDGEDEVNCESCASNSLYCDGQCIPYFAICDGHPHCNDSADEQNCTAGCSSYEFPCTSGSNYSHYGYCIPLTWRCNSIVECLDGEDEKDCDNVTCLTSQFTCVDGGDYGSCIPSYWECDNIVDCTGATDEINCTCDSHEYRCQNASTYGSCIPNHKVCDGIADCNDGEDEANCTACALNSVYCDGTCIPHYDVCDGHSHCNDSADEQDCTANCLGYEFLCTSGSDNGYCISMWRRCDNYDDCPEGEDEEGCENITCNPFQFTCSDGSCIPAYKECDDYVDCLGGTDEANCTCDTNEYKCHTGSAYGSCISGNKVCDGTEDCNDGDDESNCDGVFICADLISTMTTAIPKHKVCDGVENCLGGADENNCLIAPNGVDSGIVNIYNAANDTYYSFCSDNWVQNTGDEACSAMGYSTMTAMKDIIGPATVQGIHVDPDGSFSLSALTHRAPVDCPLNAIVVFKCSHKESCGLISKSQPRVVGGEDTTIEQHPWQISLQDDSSWTWEHFCGGSIIGGDLVLTAAHCVEYISEHAYPSHRVVAGVTAMDQTVSETSNVYSIKTIVAHPLYNSHTFQWDIALIQVTRSFVLSSNIQQACVPAPGEIFPDTGNASITGWGATSEGGDAAVTLQAANVRLYNTESCINFTSPTYSITDGMICAGYWSGGIDTCQGDSGGPLIYKRSSREYLIGVTSWGIGCARPSLPGVYAEVSEVADWITREAKRLRST